MKSLSEKLFSFNFLSQGGWDICCCSTFSVKAMGLRLTPFNSISTLQICMTPLHLWYDRNVVLWVLLHLIAVYYYSLYCTTGTLQQNVVISTTILMYFLSWPNSCYNDNYLLYTTTKVNVSMEMLYLLRLPFRLPLSLQWTDWIYYIAVVKCTTYLLYLIKNTTISCIQVSVVKITAFLLY